MTTMFWARRFTTGLVGKARALFHGLGPKGDHPSRICPIPEMDGSSGPHEWRPLLMEPRLERCIFCCETRRAK